jgi:ferredoxin
VTQPLYVHVIAEKCCGYRLCNQVCPEVFQLDDMGFATASGDAVPAELADRARAGAAACPEEAIILSDAPVASAGAGSSV